MARRLFLPVTPRDESGKPTVDAMRKRLGGRAATDPGAGEVVALTTATGAPRTGVVLFARGDDLDIWLEGGVVRRTQRAKTIRAEAAEDEILSVAHAARVFAALAEGQRVHYRHEAGVGEGSIVEKCRFGALVERHDGTVLGVGFRRLWAANTSEQN